MLSRLKSLFTALALMAPTIFVTAQKLELTNAERDSVFYKQLAKPHLSPGIRFMSNEVYNGLQVDSFAQPGFHPLLDFTLGKGWALHYEGTVLSKSKPSYALTSIGLSKEFEIGQSVDGFVDLNTWAVKDGTNRSTRTNFTTNAELGASYHLGNFSPAVYSMFIFTNPVNSFFEPSLNWEKISWIGANKNVRSAMGFSTMMDVGNTEAVSFPVTTNTITRGRKKKTITTTTTVTTNSFGILNYLIQAHQAFDFSNNHFYTQINYAIPAKSNIGYFYITLEYSKNIFLKNKKF